MAIKSDGSFDYLNLDKAIDPYKATRIISNKNVKNWDEISPVKQFPGRITKKVIPIDFDHVRMSIFTKVEPNVKVDTHMHEEPVFRFVIEGELVLNNIKYVPGDWVLVPGKTPYNVTTDIGYSVLAEYGAKCGSPHDSVVGIRNDSDH